MFQSDSLVYDFIYKYELSLLFVVKVEVRNKLIISYYKYTITANKYIKSL